MSTELIIESGLQVVTRLFDRPPVENLDNDLFFNKLENTDIIEIRGTISSGATALLTKLIAKCILPSQYNGLGVDVLFINTNNQFLVSCLYNVMKTKLCDILGPINVDRLIRETLTNLKIINCYNHHQFVLTLNTLDNILLKYKTVSFIVIDSISAYYWQQKDDLSYNSYLMKILNTIKKITVEFKVILLYTKQFHFESKKKTMDWYKGKKILRYQICLFKNENSNEFICNITSGSHKKKLYYKINEFYFTWIKEENKFIS